MEEHDEMEIRYVTLGQLARCVGVSVRTIQRLRKNGTLPESLFLKLGKRLVRVDVAKFDSWLQDFDGIIRTAPRQAPQPKPEGDNGPGLRFIG